jgi:hypothetical protein
MFGLVALALIVATRPTVLARVILPIASRAVGGDVTADVVRLGGINALVIEGLRLRAPEWDGEPGTILTADSVWIRFSPLSLLAGSVEVTDVSVGHLRLRVAERDDAPGDFSVLALKRDDVDDPSDLAPSRAMRVAIDVLEFESGVARGADFERLGSLRFAGELLRAADSPGRVTFLLRGLSDDGQPPSIGSVRGAFDPQSRAVEVALEDLLLTESGIAIAPHAVRTWTAQLGLTGRVAGARVQYRPGDAPTAELSIEGLAMDLPLELLGAGKLEESWSGLVGGKQVPPAATPRMMLREGTLRFDGDTVALVGLRGELGARDDAARVIALPFECEPELHVPRATLPPFDWEARESWFEQAAARAPFSMSVRIPNFSSPEIRPDGPDMLQLPQAAAKILADFNVSAWTFDLSTTIARAAPSADGVAAPVRTTGLLRLDRGTGAYAEFPYPLVDVKGTIRFENDDVVIERLVSRVEDGDEATISGRLIGIATGAEIDLRIECANTPIDDRLFKAFEEGPGDALRILFDAQAHTRLGAAGLLPDAAALVEQRRQLAALANAPGREAERTRLERSLAAGPFALGGRCGFVMRVYSPAGFGQPVLVTGDVRVRDAGLVFARFPYPLRIKEGLVTVLDEAVVVAEGGLRAVTPAGGQLIVSGSVQIPRERPGIRGMRPLIELNGTDDAINPALLAAIPHEDLATVEHPGWPGEDLAPAAELLRALGLSGALDLLGFVTTKPDGSDAFQIELDFRDGRAAPDAAGRAWLTKEGLPWPEGFVLESCKANIEIEPERVRFEQCTGRRGGGAITARGFADLAGPAREVVLSLDDLPIDGAYGGYLSDDPIEARRRFVRFSPSGILDGSVTRTVDANGAVTRGNLVPVWLEVTMDGTRVRADHIAGSLEVDGSNVRADSLELRLSSEGADDGILRLSGPLQVDTLDARLTDARIESPIVREFLTVRSPALVSLLRERQVRGVYDAHYTAVGGERLEVAPKSLSMHGGSSTDPSIRAALACAPGAAIRATTNEVQLDLRASVTDPAAAIDETRAPLAGEVALQGRFNLANEPTLEATYTIDVSRLTPVVHALLPPPLDLSARAIELTSTERFTLALPKVFARWSQEGNAEMPALYELDGVASFAGAAFDAGVSVTALEAVMPLHLRYEPDAEAPVDFRAGLDASGARVAGRPIGASLLAISSIQNGDGLRIDGAGNVAGGRFDMLADLDFTRDFYELRARVAEAAFDDIKSSTPPDVQSAAPGRLTARLELAGPLGGSATDVDARRGRLAVTLRDATIASTPIAMRALQLSQLMLPINSALHESDADVVIRGNTATVRSVRIASETLELNGSGTVHIPSLAVALRLYPKGTLPLLSDLIGGLSGVLFAIDVEGTLEDPSVRIAPLPGITEGPAVRTPLPEPKPEPKPEPQTP